MKIHTLEQAKEWFLENRGEGILCVKGDAEKFCKTYKEAVEFFS